MSEKRTLKRGDILLNLWAGWQTMFVYLKTSGTLAHGVTLVKFYGKYKIQKASFYRSDLNDEKNFPLVGHIDVMEMWKTAILNGIVVGFHNNHYDESGYSKQEDKCKN